MSSAGPGSTEGLYRRDTRHLSHFLADDQRRRAADPAVSSSLRDDNSVLTCDLTNPGQSNERGDNPPCSTTCIHIRRTRFVRRRALCERLTVHQLRRHAEQVGDARAPFRERLRRPVRSARRGADEARRGLCRSKSSADQVVLAYQGLDDA